VRNGGPQWAAHKAAWLIAEHGVLDTAQVAVLLGVSRPTAHRVIDGLVEVGLVERRSSPWGRDHRWYAVLSLEGRQLVTLARHQAGQPALRDLSARVGLLDRQHPINGFFVGLVGYAARAGEGAGLVSWQHRIDARRWLAEHGEAAECDGVGIWVENGVTLRFALLWHVGRRFDPDDLDHGWTAVNAALVVTGNPAHEHEVLAFAAQRRISCRLATTTRSLLEAETAADAVWAIAPDGPRRRLIELTAPS
jgi:DNA-binding MarR family transcriptional regulator